MIVEILMKFIRPEQQNTARFTCFIYRFINAFNNSYNKKSIHTSGYLTFNCNYWRKWLSMWIIRNKCYHVVNILENLEVEKVNQTQHYYFRIHKVLSIPFQSQIVRKFRLSKKIKCIGEYTKFKLSSNAKIYCI